MEVVWILLLGFFLFEKPMTRKGLNMTAKKDTRDTKEEIFVPIKYDAMFKRIFGLEDSKEILKSFLGAVLQDEVCYI
jgi:hypothetical protein